MRMKKIKKRGKVEKHSVNSDKYVRKSVKKAANDPVSSEEVLESLKKKMRIVLIEREKALRDDPKNAAKISKEYVHKLDLLKKQMRDIILKNQNDSVKESSKEKVKKGKKVVQATKLANLKNPSKKADVVSVEDVKNYSKVIENIKLEMHKVVVGQEDVLNSIMRAVLCNGHILLEGVPGIAKTLMIRSLGAASGALAKRIQFTVDLLPTDILGMTTYTPNKGFEVVKGPIFANFIIADEINRSPPKTQSALLEAMQEKQATIGKETYKLPLPFFVMANENPLETSGVYPLPEAQVDRFLFKVLVGYPRKDEEIIVMDRNMTLRKFEEFGLQKVTNPVEIMKMQQLVKKIYASESIKKYIVNIVNMTREKKGFSNARFIEWGSSPRASIGLYIAAKSQAFLMGRNYVTPQDVKEVAHDVLRHRLILKYEATAEGISSDDVVDSILSKVKVP